MSATEVYRNIRTISNFIMKKMIFYFCSLCVCWLVFLLFFFFSLFPTTERSWASACAAPCILNSFFFFSFWCGGSVCQSSRARLRSWRAQESDKESKPIILMPLFNSSRSFWDSPLSVRQSSWVPCACGYRMEWTAILTLFAFTRSTRKRKNYCSRSVNNNNLEKPNRHFSFVFFFFVDFSTLSGPSVPRAHRALRFGCVMCWRATEANTNANIER